MKICKFAVLAICFFFSGCLLFINSSTNVTNDPRYWGGYKPGLEVILEQDVFIHLSGEQLVPEKYYNHESSPKNLEFTWPKSFDEYFKAPEQYPEFKILTKGAVIKCTKIEFIESLSYAMIDIYGNIESGDFKNTTVSLRFLSDAANNLPHSGVYCLKPNPRYLKPVEKKNGDD